MKSEYKERVLLVIFIVCLICSIATRISPLTERYEGASGFKYEYGMFFSLLSIILFFISIVSLLAIDWKK